MSSTLPPPDPGEGHNAFMEAEGKRKEASTALSDGSMALDDLFEQIDAEDGDAIGHMHVRHALIALPHIGETKADQILEALGIEGGRHLESLGSEQRKALAQEIADRSPRPSH